MKNKKSRCSCLLVVLMLGLMITGCDIINPDETLPTVIKLEPFDFLIKPGQGSAQNKIPEVWVYANSSFLGAFTPPVNVNYLEEGPTTFTFRPGIRNNGILADAIVYPLFSGYTIQLDAAPGSVFEVNPVTQYKPEAVFSLVADFELSNEFTDNRDTIDASVMVRSTTDVYEGQYSGEMIMSPEASFIEVGQSVPMGDLPTDGTEAYLELRYKNEVEFSIGLLGSNLEGQSYSNFFYLVKPNSEWNMLYIELTDLLKVSGLTSYKILFRSLYPANSTAPEYHIFLDNIKVVHL